MSERVRRGNGGQVLSSGGFRRWDPRYCGSPERRTLVATFNSNHALRLSGHYGRGQSTASTRLLRSVWRLREPGLPSAGSGPARLQLLRWRTRDGHFASMLRFGSWNRPSTRRLIVSEIARSSRSREWWVIGRRGKMKSAGWNRSRARLQPGTDRAWADTRVSWRVDGRIDEHLYSRREGDSSEAVSERRKPGGSAAEGLPFWVPA